MSDVLSKAAVGVKSITLDGVVWKRRTAESGWAWAADSFDSNGWRFFVLVYHHPKIEGYWCVYDERDAAADGPDDRIYVGEVFALRAASKALREGNKCKT